MLNYSLLASCLEAAAAIVVARGRVSQTSEATLKLQVTELATALYSEILTRTGVDQFQFTSKE